MTNTSHSQKGSAFIVIIVILTVALIGALGFIFWQNFIHKEPVAVEVIAKTKEVEKIDPNKGYLVLEDWKVRFKLPDDISEVRYYKEKVANENGTHEYYEFTTKRVEELGESCVESDTSDSAMRLAALSRSKTRQEEFMSSGPLNNNEPIEGYYYILSGGQSLCANNGDDIQTKDHGMVLEMLQHPESY